VTYRVSLSDMLAAALLLRRLRLWVALESQTEMRVTAEQCVGGLGDSHCERGARGCWRRRVKGRSPTTARVGENNERVD